MNTCPNCGKVAGLHSSILQGCMCQYSMQAPPQPEQEPVALEEYDAGLLNDFGGGNVEWWWDYIRAELGRAYKHYQSQITTPPQRTEQNFCPRCGKRTKDIHTCTPPMENT